MKNLEIQKLKSRLSDLNELCFEQSMGPQQAIVLNEDLEHLGDDVAVNAITHTRDTEVNYLNKLLDEKSCLIIELHDKIDILKKHINLLEKIEKINPTEPSTRMVPDELVASVEETVVTDDFIPVITKKSAMSISKDNGNISDSGTKSKTENFLTNFVSNKKGRRSQKNKLNRGNHETKKDLMVTGAGAVSSDFMGAPRRAWMYVGRVNVNVKESQIENHLKGKFPGEDFSIERLPKRDAAHSASFKIGASLSLVEDLYKPQNWPTGVVVKRFRFFQSSTNQ